MITKLLRFMLAWCVVFLLLLAACDETPQEPLHPPGSVLATANAQADALATVLSATLTPQAVKEP